jgi:hypothetical protein
LATRRHREIKLAGCQPALQAGIKKGRFDPVFLCISSAMVVVMLSERSVVFSVVVAMLAALGQRWDSALVTMRL